MDEQRIREIVQEEIAKHEKEKVANFATMIMNRLSKLSCSEGHQQPSGADSQ